MVYKLCMEAEKGWRKLGGFKLIPLVVAVKKFVNGNRSMKRLLDRRNDTSFSSPQLLTISLVHSAEQGYDTSCGLSSLACLLNTYWNIPADESSLATEFLVSKQESGDFTVSFADARTILKAKSFAVAAYKMNYDQLVQAASRYAPLLIHYDKPVGHFALVLKADPKGPVVADPAAGTGALDRGAFLSKWSGNVLLAARPGESPQAAMIEDAVRLAKGRLELLDRASHVFERGDFR